MDDIAEDVDWLTTMTMLADLAADVGDAARAERLYALLEPYADVNVVIGLGVALASFVNIFNPEVIVIGGGVIAAGELLLDPARQVMAERALPPSRDEVRIVGAHFGVEAGMIGAAALAFDGVTQQ